MSHEESHKSPVSISSLFRPVAAAWLAALALCASPAFAQDPYVDPFPQPACHYSPYVESLTCPHARMRLVIGEGVVGKPGAEFAWVILVNTEPVAQRATIAFLVDGKPQPVVQEVVLAPQQRVPVSVHEHPFFVSRGQGTFSTMVYFRHAGYAELVMRSASNLWGAPLINQGVVVPLAAASTTDGER